MNSTIPLRLAACCTPATNEIVLLYENIGFEHGYIPMEELSGIRQAGLSDDEKTITKLLDWQVATNLGGVTAGWTQPDFAARGWSKVALDTNTPIARKGNGIQPKDSPGCAAHLVSAGVRVARDARRSMDSVAAVDQRIRQRLHVAQRP